MPAPRELIRVSRRAATRLTVLRSMRIGARASVLLLLAAVGASLVSMILPLTVPTWRVLTIALGAGVVVTLAAAALRPVGMLAASRLLDQRLHLQERISTALELARIVPSPSGLEARVILDAVEHAHGVELTQAFPLHPPREAWWAAGVAIVFVVVSLGLHGVTVPGTPADHSARVIREEGSRLARVAQALQARARAERTPQTRRLTAQLRDLGIRLQQERMGRGDALARVEAAARQAEQARREVNGRLEALQPAPRRDPTGPLNLLRRQALARQIKQLQELNARLSQELSAADRQNALERLAAMGQGGDEGQSAQVQRQLQQAREQLQRGNIGKANDAVSEALRTLEGMQSLVADEEGLRNVQQQLQRSSAAIASGAAEATPRDAAALPPPLGQAPTASGPNPPAADSSTEPSPPPPGPNEGTTAGTGQVTDKLGAATSRLQVQKAPERLRGTQGEGTVTASEVLGAARPGVSRAPVTAAPFTLVAQADRYMERAGIPARYRLLVRRYFERLVQLR